MYQNRKGAEDDLLEMKNPVMSYNIQCMKLQTLPSALAAAVGIESDAKS